jgi:GntR family transcriptional repressor for pyruvate dehydrogenase complex
MIVSTGQTKMSRAPTARNAESARQAEMPSSPMATDLVTAYVHDLIESGECRPGDRLPSERDLAGLVGVSRPSVRAAIQALAALGVVEARRGSGTFITDRPFCFTSGSLRFFAALHGISEEHLFEVRRFLEMDMAELAAERATGAQLAAISEEVMEMFAVRGDPEHFLVHDIRFHHAVSRAAGNPVLGALAEMVAEAFFEWRRESVIPLHGAAVAAEHHKKIYKAIRDQDPERARREMSTHMHWAEQVRAIETDVGQGFGGSRTETTPDEP